MKELIKRIFGYLLYDTPIEIRKRFLSIIITGCEAIFICNFVAAILTNCGLVGIIVNLTAVVFSFIIHFFSKHLDSDRKYEQLMICLVAFTCLIFFPLEYLTCGGVSGGNPMTAIWGLIMTVLLCKKRPMITMLILEVLFFTATFTYTYFSPSVVTTIADDDFVSYAHIYLSMLIIGYGSGVTYKKIENDMRAKQKSEDELSSKIKLITTKDSQTGLLNRTSLEDVISLKIEDVQNDIQLPFCLAAFTIDSFETLKSSLSEDSISEIIKNFSMILKRNFNYNNEIIRYSECEFICILCTNNETAAYRKAEQIRITVCDYGLCRESELPVTVSGGVTIYRSGDNSKSLISTALANMDVAVKNDGNQIVWHNGATPPVCYNVTNI